MTTLAENKKPIHFAQMDALRFAAAFMVVIVHAWDGWTGWYGTPAPLRGNADAHSYNWFGDRLHHIIGNFNFGVDMFFMISGFLITYLMLREKSSTGKIDIPKFYLRRIFRIWPLYYFIIAITPLLIYWTGFAKPEYKPVIFFYNNFRTIATEQWTFPFAHFWSICVEEHFYLLWPFLVALFPIKRLPSVFLTVIIFSIGFRAYCSIHGWSWYHGYLNTFSRIDALALGGLGAWIIFHRPFKLKVPVYARLLVYISMIWLLSYDDLNEWNTLFDMLFKKYLYLLLFGMMMLNYVFNEDAALRWGPKHPVNYLGRCCFGIYLWGNIILNIFINKVTEKHPFMTHWYMFWPAIIFLSLIIPIISYELIEKPFMKFKSRFAIVKTRV
ncbi:MAG: acyltransferase [Bacteroidetes bacterium]|nr:acyltransferase [Bacteroidota bacterium]